MSNFTFLNYNLAALIHEPTFRENLEPCLFPKILTIQKIGNLAVHSDKPISSSDALHTLKELFQTCATRYQS